MSTAYKHKIWKILSMQYGVAAKGSKDYESRILMWQNIIVMNEELKRLSGCCCEDDQPLIRKSNESDRQASTQHDYCAVEEMGQSLTLNKTTGRKIDLRSDADSGDEQQEPVIVRKKVRKEAKLEKPVKKPRATTSKKSSTSK